MVKNNFNIARVFCIGRNYVEHVQELKNIIFTKPVVFIKPASCLIGPGEKIHFHIKHRDKNMAATQQSEFGSCGPDISPVRSEVRSIGPEAMLFSKASYTVIDTVPGVL